MSAYYDLVLNSVCRSNHHRIAIMALQHLTGEDAEQWRNLFLKWHPTYLEGSKAPDAQFKDFRNHVVHPGDGFWGGAPQAATEWYKRLLRALGEGDWEHAVWSAGVMSHYIADPCQPFHTDQCEAEGVIHRAAEWSFSKAFPELKLIIEQHVGFPEIEMPTGDDWVAKLVRNGALRSNPHYHELIDHYDLEKGRKKPEAALDQQAKDIVAGLIAYATVNVATVINRAIVESRARPPKTSLMLSTLFVGMKTPIHSVLKKLDHEAGRKVVAAQYEEYRRTGKVRETLGEDDKIVRALHAEEIQGVHIATIDAEWPREHGLAHGEGAEARVHKKIKVKKPKAEKAAKPPRIVKPGMAEPEPETVAEYYRDPEPAPDANAKPAEPAEAVVAAAPASQPAAPADRKAPRIRLTREALVVDAPSIGPKTAGRFYAIGVKTVDDLLTISAEDASKQIKASHVSAKLIREWQAQALLACSVPDITGTTAQMLVGAGVLTPEDLASAEPAFLLQAIAEFARTREGEGALRGAAPPDQARVEKWIASAKAPSAAA